MMKLFLQHLRKENNQLKKTKQIFTLKINTKQVFLITMIIQKR